jgi:AcrR family transcriptional regulator
MKASDLPSESAIREGWMARTSAAPAQGDGTSVPARRSDPRRARTRAALIRAAQHLLAEGRVEVSIQEITDTAGVGFGSFYNHFEDKAQLWAAAVSETLRAHGDLVRAITSDLEDSAEVFCIGLRLTGRLQRAFPVLTRVLLNTGVSALLGDQQGLLAYAREDLTAAISAGRFDIDDVELALHITAGSLLGLMCLLDARPDVDADALADQYAIRLLRSFGLRPAEATRLVARPLPERSAAGWLRAPRVTAESD